MPDWAPLARLDEELAGIVRDAYDASGTEYLFGNKWERTCVPTKVREFLKRAAVKVLGAEMGAKVTPHYFRHRFCTECGKAGVAMVDVKAIAGIKDTKVLLQYYCHATSDGMDRVYRMTGL